MAPEQTTSTQPPETTPTQPIQTTPTQPPETTGGIYDPKSTLEQYITPKEVHWVDISEISSFSIQNIMGTVLMNVGTLVIGMTSQVEISEGGAVQLRRIIEILGIILFIVGICFFGASYLITLRRLKQKKKRLNA